MALFAKLNDEDDRDLPKYETRGSSGMDLRAFAPGNDIFIGPGKWKAVPTGISCNIPLGKEIQVRPRGGTAFHHGVTVLNAPGTIDSDYEGEIMVILINHSDTPFRIQHGDRIAQAVLAPVIIDSDSMRAFQIKRGEGRYNSTGVK